MRLPARRPSRKAVLQHCEPEKLEKASRHAVYVGSAEHKAVHTWLGPRKLRSDATPCPADIKSAEAVTPWLKEAISRGNVSEYWEADFPRYVWMRDGDFLYEGRLMNQVNGEYKGYPIEPDQAPRGLQ